MAIDLPKEFCAKISTIQSKFIWPGLRLVDPSLVHITLKFLGDVDEEKLQEIISVLDNIDCLSFDSDISGVGAFSSLKNPRVVWLGVDGDFSCIHRQVEALLSDMGFKKESHKFTPHATIARVAHLSGSYRKEFVSEMEHLKNYHLGQMRVDTVKLKKSTLTTQGPIYETLHEVKLV